jgi:hypothetical protein
MFKIIMAFWGYVKIPTAVIQLSIAQEHFLDKCRKHESDPRGKEYFAKYLEGQKAITSFLRSGRLISF